MHEEVFLRDFVACRMNANPDLAVLREDLAVLTRDVASLFEHMKCVAATERSRPAFINCAHDGDARIVAKPPAAALQRRL